MLTSPACSTDTDCDNITIAASLGPGLLKCCKKADLCGAALHTCVGPSACDVAALIVPPVTDQRNPFGVCPGGQDGECPPPPPELPQEITVICDTTHRCVFNTDRAAICSWGLIDATGAPKPAWPEFLARSEAFVP